MIASGTNHGWPGVLGPTLRVNMRKVTFIGWVRTPRTDTVHDRRVEGSASAVGGGGDGTLGPHPCCLPALPLTRYAGLGHGDAEPAQHMTTKHTVT